jgi:hypothetical protein
MPTSEIATTTISVFTRHSPECPKRDNPQWKRCNCRKSLYIYEGGKVKYISAKTRSWESAEKIAQQERDARDPVKQELQKIAEREAQKDAAARSKGVPFETALDRWISGLKGQEEATRSCYQTIKRTLLHWAEGKGIQNVGDVTADLLDEWVGKWSPDAPDRENRLAQTLRDSGCRGSAASSVGLTRSR